MGKGLSVTVLSTLAAALVVAGLFVSGSPTEARKLRRDEVRLDDISRLKDNVTCLAVNGEAPLPDAPHESDNCPQVLRLADPYTDAPYRYEKLDRQGFRICAEFELSEALPDYRPDLDIAAGCVVGSTSPDLDPLGGTR